MIDIAIDNEFHDLMLDVDASGKIAIVLQETTPQDQWNLLVHHQGEFKEHPTLGIGIDDMANDHELANWRRTVQTQMETVGMTVSHLVIDENKFQLIAKY